MAIAGQALALLAPDDPDHRALAANVAILRRENGRPDEAARLLEDLLQDAPDTDRLSILESLCTTMTILGQYAAALDVRTSSPNWRSAGRRPEGRVGVGEPGAGPDRFGSRGRGRRALRGVSPEAASDPVLALMLVACRVNLVWNAEGYATPEVVAAIAEDLKERIADAAQRGDELELDALDLRAFLFQAVGEPRATELWSAARARRRERTGLSSSSEEAWLACNAFLAGDSARGREHLAALTRTMADLTGGVVDVVEAADSGAREARPLDVMLAVVMSGPDPVVEDARIVADLRRDVVARAAAHRDEAQPLVDTDRLVAIGRALGDVAVVEWIDSPTGNARCSRCSTAAGTCCPAGCRRCRRSTSMPCPIASSPGCRNGGRTCPAIRSTWPTGGPAGTG